MTQETNTTLNEEKSVKSEKKKKKKASFKERKSVGGIAAVSLLIALFDKLSEIICRALVNGFWGSICSAYAKMERAFEHGFLREFIFSDRRFKKIFRRFRHFLSGHIEN